MTEASMQVHTVAAPVRQQVFDSVRQAIISGRFRSGQRLVEKDLCELMGVSRPSVREALRQLESEGLVETIPNRGPVVATLSREEAVNIYQVRGALEGLAAKLFAEQASAELVNELNDACNALSQAIADRNFEGAIKAKDQFYTTLFHGAKNPTIAAILRTMNARITFLRRVSLSSPDRWPFTLKEIKAVMAAIKRRDGDAAQRATLHHVEKAAEVALKTIGGA